MPRFDDGADELPPAVRSLLDHHHLRARDHDVANLHVADRERTFDHRQGVGAEHVAPFGIAQDAHERGPIARLALHRPAPPG